MFKYSRKNDAVSFFVSIGAGVNQLPLIREAKSQRFHVIGVDSSPVAPGFIACDLKIQESIDNYEEIYQKLIELLVDGEIRGIMTKSYGNAIVTASFLASRFRIPFLPFDISTDFMNKKHMKTRFLDGGIPTPDPITLHGKNPWEKVKSHMFPLVRKPQTGHAKTDVRLLSTMEDLKNDFLSNGSDGVIYERFIQGEEIIAAGIVHDGRYYLVDITDKVTTPPPHFVDIKHISPSCHWDKSSRITEIGQKVADAFTIKSSPLIMEIMVNNNELYVIEAVPEFGGEFLPDVLIPARTGYNFIGEAIKSHTGNSFTPPQKKREKGAVVVQYISGEKGTLVSCNPDGPKHIPGILFSRIFKDIGSEVREPENNLDRIGVVVVKGNTVEQALECAEMAASSFNIRIRSL